jgi:F-type H+-transporting ATPase subunit delta
MKKVKIKNYSKALVRLDVKQGVVEQLIADLESVAEKLNTTLELKRFLSDKHFSLTEKKQALKAVFQDFISEKTYNFVLLLIKDKKLRYFNQLIEQIKKENLVKHEVFEVVVESVVPLTAKQEKQLQNVFFEKLQQQVIVKNLIDESLIGGLKVTIKDQVIDASLFGKINHLREKINKFE